MRGARVFSFALSLQTGDTLTREINLTRAKVMADILDASTNASPYHVEERDDEKLKSLRGSLLSQAAILCRSIEAVDQRIFDGQKKNTLPDSPEAILGAQYIPIPWRGSVTDLVTDLVGELSDVQLKKLSDALVARTTK